MKTLMEKILNNTNLLGAIVVITSILTGITGFNILREPSPDVATHDAMLIVYWILFGILVLCAFIFFINMFINKKSSASAKDDQSRIPEIASPSSELSVDFIITLKRSGIKSLHWGSDFKKLTEKLDEKDIKEVKILVYHGNHLLDYIYQELTNILKRPDTKVCLLVTQYNSPFMNEVWEMEEKCARKSYVNIDISRKNQGEVYKKIDAFKKFIETTYGSGKLEIKIYNTQVRYALILVDNMWAWWTPYHTGINVHETTSFVLEGKSEKDNDAILSQCRDHYKALWDNSMQWSSPNIKMNKGVTP